ncbi:2-dehydro-3-deoxygluconokinase [Halarchaeum rubridurum]|uniref:2-dehydro-3-deoxygluconokinase n=1 Tax=Halarchaeum rubridurum TaxID=489911 RepID=A0A830G0I2_9EURY|nr:bifunctional 2-dehydro-3-deoxygluconokinase/2-dehydro-3-deoxygalactonokinase [Halarchaeum rubridurum]MBP1955077.1 2-dehydro-3-deoxygluconokinase [Halarchaeum rubridurum]GGM69143.1 2-keto-3-deoxygluconate kinase [Halarchaeum rubridurum]
MSDLVTFGETMLRLSPPGQERIERASELEFRAAGAESNVAVNAGRLGLDTAWLSKLPDSALGRKVTATVESQGAEADVVWSDEGRQGTYYLEQASTPRPTNVIYDRADAAVTTATPAELPTERIESADAFYTSGITPALSDTLEETTAALLALAREADTTTVFDVNYRSKLWSPAEARPVLESLFPDIDVLVTAVRDARTVLGLDGDAERVARDLAEEWGFETVVVTRGAEGALAWHAGDVVEQPAFEADTHDAVGTGDAFVGGFLARRLRGDGVPAALEYAAATAALKRTIPGDTALVTPAEVEGVLDRSGDDIAR